MAQGVCGAAQHVQLLLHLGPQVVGAFGKVFAFAVEVISEGRQGVDGAPSPVVCHLHSAHDKPNGGHSLGVRHSARMGAQDAVKVFDGLVDQLRNIHV